MPIYDYVCGSCGHRFEVIRGINEAGPHQCPECGGPVARAFVPPTIHFKGSGWAKSDRRATSAPARHTDGGGPSTEPSKPSSDGGSDVAAGPVGKSANPREASSTGDSASADSASSGRES